VRTILVTCFAGEVHYNAQKLPWTLQQSFSNTKSYTVVLQTQTTSLLRLFFQIIYWEMHDMLQLERLERFIALDPTGVQIFGMFLITRRSLISILMFLFSFQIVLIQAVPSTA
jgi:hypothetical protein